MASQNNKCTIGEKKLANIVFSTYFPYLICVLTLIIDIRLFSDQKTEEIPLWHKKKDFCVSYNVFSWTLLQLLSDWRIYRQHWWPLAKWVWYDKKLSKKCSEAIMGFKLFISGNSCGFAICRRFFVCVFFYVEKWDSLDR